MHKLEYDLIASLYDSHADQAEKYWSILIWGLRANLKRDANAQWQATTLLMLINIL